MLWKFLPVRYLLPIFVVFLVVMGFSLPAHAVSKDPYVLRYLHVSEPVAINLDNQGQTRLFSAEDLSSGKRLFEENCKTCHVGGATLPDPLVSLSLEDLQGANPSRDNVNSLVAYLRQPMVYDGSEATYWCRQVPDTWMPQEQVEDLAAFVLRAAQEAPGWGEDTF